MSFPLMRNQKPAFGLDISGSSFKILQLEKKGSATALKAFSDVATPKGMIVNDAIVDGKSFGQLLQHSLDKPQFGQVSTNYAVVSLPESKSFVRVIQIPLMTDSEAESAVPVEAESFIPLPVDQVYLDWQKIGEKDDKMSLLMVASPKDFVDQYLALLDGAGIKTAVLEVESQSLVRALLPPASTENVLIVDLDAYRSSLVMVEEGHLQFTSTVPIAGNSFTDSIANLLGVSSAKAEEIKRKIGIANTADYPNIKISLLPVLNNLSAEIKSILRFHKEHSGKDVSRIILAGGSAKLKNLPEFLTLEFPDFSGLQVSLGDPWTGLGDSRHQQLGPSESLGYSTAIGLAMRGLNLSLG